MKYPTRHPRLALSLQAVLLTTLAAPSLGRQGSEPLPDVLVDASPSSDAGRLYYDEPGDGNLWVRTDAYKARFGAEGARFVPFLGSQAERNRPVDFRLAEVTLGGEPLAFENPLRAERDGDLVSLDRGSLVELYAMSSGGMEQLFRFDDLPRSGELVVKIDVDTELAPLERAQGLEWGCAEGCVRYGRATVLDAYGSSAVAPTRLVQGGLEIRVPGDFVATAELPLTIDPLIHGFPVDTSAATDLLPDVAYEGVSGTYMLAWARVFSATDYDIWCEQRTPQGAYVAGSGTYIDTTTTSWLGARVAANSRATQFLVVSQLGSGSAGRIYGRTCESGQASLGSVFPISPESGSQSQPDVGGTANAGIFSPNQYFVVWEHDGPNTPYYDIQGRAVSPAGVLGDLRLLDLSAVDSVRPAISNSCGYGGADQVWTVVWEHDPTYSDGDIWGAQVAPDGQVAHGTFPIDTSPNDDHDPVVSTVLDGSGERAYLVAWRRQYSSDPDIQARAMRGNSPATPSLSVSAMSGLYWRPFDQIQPSVESDGSSFLVAYAESSDSLSFNVNSCTFVLSDGDLEIGDQHALIAGTTTLEGYPRIASTRSGGGGNDRYMVAWNNFPQNFEGDIHAGIYESPGAGHEYCISQPNSSGQIATTRVRGSISLSQNDMTLVVENAPPNKPGLFFYGTSQVNLPFGEGRRCVGGQVYRITGYRFTDAQGRVERDLDFGHAAYGSGFFAGAPGLNVQFWFRDAPGGPQGFNTSSGVHFELQP